MNKKIRSTKILILAKKLKAINKLGGKCKMCGDSDFFHLGFHHIDSTKKDYGICELKSYRWSKIEKELDKCILLCNNCHQELHYKDVKSKPYLINKKTFLEYKKTDSCVVCGYNKCNASLHFHHINKDLKNFRLAIIRILNENVLDIPEYIKKELDKCEVMCINCHIKNHSDVNFFIKNEKEIIEKSLNLKYLQPKLDRELIKKMYFEENKKQIEIAKYFKASKSTISGIIKKLK